MLCCRSLSVFENIVAVLMAVAVGALGALVLSCNFYHDIWIFVFCFIIAGCQYCLLKVSIACGIWRLYYIRLQYVCCLSFRVSGVA